MYFLWLLIFIVFPLVIIWFFHFRHLWKYRKTLLFSIISTFIVSIPWDIYAVKTHIWFFPMEGSSGIYIGILPLEEYLFMAIVTLLAASITIVLKYRLKSK